MDIPKMLIQVGAMPAPEEGRYSIHPVGDKFVRLDIRTGQVSVCGHGPSGWACQAVADDRVALDAELSRLQAENAALKKKQEQEMLMGLKLPGATTSKAEVLVKRLSEEAKRDPAAFAQVVRTWMSDSDN